jgi:DNA-directed RNA polymerase subunit RPC12/RpoP
VDNSADNSGIGAFFAVAPIVFIFLGLVFWIAQAALAAFVAPADRRLTFGLVTFFLLGPLGLVAALVANPRTAPEPPSERPAVAGRRRFICPRCVAANDIPEADTSYDCWRCSEHRPVKAKAIAAK